MPKTDESTNQDLVPAQRTVPPLLMSVLLHVILLTSIALIWNKIPHAADSRDDRPVGIAMVSRMPDRDLYVDSAELSEAQNELTAKQANPSSADSAPPADLVPPLDLAGVLASIESTPTPDSGLAPSHGLAGETSLDGDAFGSQRGAGPAADASQATTSVFGISGSGSRFVYVFDRSDSMNGFGGNPLRQAKLELIRSLKTLTDRQQFQIVFYNDKPTPFKQAGLPLRMVSAEPGSVAQAVSYVRSIAAFGGTSHEEALRLALRMGPDVIFFLTDASIPRLSAKQLREIKNRADSVGTTIHAIEFGGDSAAPRSSFLRELAAMNRGQYRYIDVRRFQRDNSERQPSAAP